MAEPNIRREGFPPGKPQASPNMFIRVVTGIAEHFDVRFPEWLGAAALIGWGINLMVTPVSWTNPEAWSLMLSIMPEDTWGLVCTLSGWFWLLALTINGTFATTAYSRYSPNVRGTCALISASIWFLVLMSVLSANSSGRGIYWLPLVLSVWCIFHSWRDVGRRK
jgi:hypothetical protein